MNDLHPHAFRCGSAGGQTKSGEPCMRWVRNDSPFSLCALHRDPADVAAYRRRRQAERLDRERRRIFTVLTTAELKLGMAGPLALDSSPMARVRWLKASRRIALLRRELEDIVALIDELGEVPNGSREIGR